MLVISNSLLNCLPVVSHFSLGKRLTVVTSEFRSIYILALIVLSVQKRERCTEGMGLLTSLITFSECQTSRMHVQYLLTLRPTILRISKMFSGI